MVPVKVKKEAINFLFPTLGENTSAYKDICKYIEKQFKAVNCSVLWIKDKEFARIAYKHGLRLDSKEVIIRNGCILAADNFEDDPKVILKCDSFVRNKIESILDELDEKEDFYYENCTV